MKQRFTCPGGLAPLATIAVLALPVGSQAQENQCDRDKRDCEARAQHSYDLCVQAPVPAFDCEGRYQQDRYRCDRDWTICMDNGGGGTPINQDDWPPSS